MAIAILNMADPQGARVLRVCSSRVNGYHSFATLQIEWNKTTAKRRLAIAILKAVRNKGQLVPTEEIESIIHQEK